MKRPSALILCLATTALAAAAPAGPKGGPVLLDVEPAAAPVPALKYQLLPEVSELNPGNAVPAYLKCFAEQNNFFYQKESVEERERLLQCPLSDIKPGSLKDYGGGALRQADHAARLEYADWNLLPQMREHGYMLVIPEVQQMRTLVSALKVRARGQIVDRDYDGAVRTLKTIFAMARHMGDHPTIIAGLVGRAIGLIGLGLVEEFIQQPGAPNLYWALTGLPDPLVDARKGVSADRVGMQAMFGPLLDNRRAWTADDVATATRKMKEVGGLMDLPQEDRKLADEWMRARIKDEGWLAGARKGLTDAGYPAGAVAKYPPEQVVFYHLYRKGLVEHDEAIKWLNVPYWQAEVPLAERKKAPAELEDKLARLTVMPVEKLMASEARLAQRLALLRAAEAVRLHAAKSGGKLPASLTDLEVPVPVDPVTGKAFGYKLDGLTAVIDGREVMGTKPAYEIRLRK